jgi:hypothetical protein
MLRVRPNLFITSPIRIGAREALRAPSNLHFRLSSRTILLALRWRSVVEGGIALKIAVVWVGPLSARHVMRVQ